ncbi:MAG: substrate-binding domain-containing protein [Eubacterium sp.]|nr:substrate-binding domain-containing protein [Eubacterium sp.]
MKKARKILAVLMCGAMMCLALAGCSSNKGGDEAAPETESQGAGSDTQAAAPETEAPDAGSDTQAAASTTNGDAPYVAFSTGATNTTWRQEMVDFFSEVADEYQEAGRISGYTIANNTTDWDVTDQISVIRDLIADDNVDIIVVNPNSPTDLNAVLAEAVAAGKLVVCGDCEVDVEGVYCCSVDHYQWAYNIADAICKQLDGKGNVVEISGADGHPANEERERGTAEACAQYPDINLVYSQPGGWDNQTAKEVLSTYLSSSAYTVDAVITQETMGYGILQALEEMNSTTGCMDNLKSVYLETSPVCLELYQELKEKYDFDVVAEPNPAGILASSLRVAVNLYEGKEPKELGGLYGRCFIYDVEAFYETDTISELIDIMKDYTGDYTLSEHWTEEEAAALFK